MKTRLSAVPSISAASERRPTTPKRIEQAPRSRRSLGRWLRRAMEGDVERVLRHLVRPDDRVLEITATTRSLAASLGGSAETISVDVSDRRRGVSELRERLRVLAGAPFDVVFLEGVVSYAADIQEVLAAVRTVCQPDTRLVLLSYNAFWAPALRLATRLGLRARMPDENWLSSQDVKNLLALTDLELVTFRRRVLLPATVPLGCVANRVLAELPVLSWLGLCDWYVARPGAAERAPGKVSVVVPARNEAGNIRRILDEVPEIGTGVEVIFVEGGSTDGTWETIERERERYRGPARVRALRQRGKGKKDAAFLGLDEATGDYLVILDADVTVPPADLPKFYDVLRSGKGEFVNGTRLVYPLQPGAMRFLNMLGNRFFAAAFSYILGQPLKDTLCGTKALSRRNWRRLRGLAGELGERDPFGDFDLLFGAARLQLRTIEVPIRYQARSYGETNIARWRHGLMLLKMCGFGLRFLKFV